jgi:hypothetical protein
MTRRLEFLNVQHWNKLTDSIVRVFCSLKGLVPVPPCPWRKIFFWYSAVPDIARPFLSLINHNYVS